MKIFKKILKISYFKEKIQKLTLNKVEHINEKEIEYLLTIAILFLKEFDNNKEKRIYLKFGYYIILKYSLRFKDFKSLYDFSINFGFYPIVLSIIKKQFN